MQLKFRRAISDDAENIASVLKDAANWLDSKGIKQWNTDMFSLDGMHKAIREYNVFLAYLGNELAGTVRVQWSDRMVWGDGSELVGAAYVHRLAVNPQFTGRAIGRQLLSFAEEFAKSNGKSLMRLDCWGENPRMIRYYQDAGYTYIDTVLYDDTARKIQWCVARFEKEIE